MIKTKDDLKEYLEQDKIQLGINRKYPRPFTDEIWKYEIILRKYEYWYNQATLVSKVMRSYYKMKLHNASVRLRITIGVNTCDKGLSIAHINGININHNAKIGKNCRIHEGVTIGASGGNIAPVIGDNVFLGSGAKVMGNVRVANRCAIGANAVVVKSVLEEGITVAGVPAKKISNHDSDKFIYWYRN